MRIYRAALWGAGGGAVIGWLLAAGADTADMRERLTASIVTMVVCALIGFLVGGLAAAIMVANQPYRLSRWVPLPPAVIQRHAAKHFTAAGWAVTGSHGDTVSFARETGPAAGTALLLFLLGIVPGILYLLLARRTHVISVTVTRAPDGSELAIAANRAGDGGERATIDFFNSLHEVTAAGPVGVPVR